MIRFTDAHLLASTKLRTRRIRTVFTVVISGLLFACLVAALFVGTGIDRSIELFSKEGLGGRYIVATGVDQSNTARAITNQGVADRAIELHKQLVSDKQRAAKRLGIAYDASLEVNPIATFPGVSGQSSRILNITSPAAILALREYGETHPEPGLAELQVAAKGYSPIGFYTATAGVVGDGNLAIMQDGKEVFTNEQDQGSDILSSGIEQVSAELSAPFLLPGQTSAYTGNAIPVIVSYSQAAKLLNIDSVPENSSAEQKLDHIQSLYAEAGGVIFTACYRNTVSQQQIQTAISQKANGIEEFNEKLQYGLPAADSCNQAVVVSDTRSTSEKELRVNQDTFNRQFGQTVDPVQQKLTFKIVGLKPSPNNSFSTTFGGLLENLVGQSLNESLTIPANLFQKMSDAETVRSVLFPEQRSPLAFSPNSYFVEFANADDARAFIAHESCNTNPNGQCGTEKKPFYLYAYGSNSIALEDFQRNTMRLIVTFGLVVTALATVIMGGTIGRMIADGRRETAVFRAIGAKRIDIVAIYIVYVLYLTLFVAAFAFILGLVIAYYFDYSLWQSMTAQAQLVFGASNTSHKFHLFGYTPLISYVLALAIGCGLLGALLPLLLNARRSPIRDMRDE